RPGQSPPPVRTATRIPPFSSFPRFGVVGITRFRTQARSGRNRRHGAGRRRSPAPFRHSGRRRSRGGAAPSGAPPLRRSSASRRSASFGPHARDLPVLPPPPPSPEPLLPLLPRERAPP